MKKCKYCQTEIDPKDKICPNCRKKQGRPVWLIILLVFVGVMIIASDGIGDDDIDNTSISGNDGSSVSNDSSSTNKSSEKFSYVVNDSYSNGYSYYIEGTVTNNKNKEYSYVQIEFVCYDKDGNNLGTAIDNTNNLLGNETWKFKAMGLFTDGSTVDHCDFREVTGW